jgi:DHA1 family multidrug resistance protein-like MFS transporter
MSNRKDQNFQPPVYAALALAFSSFGDAFLYPFLPLHGKNLGMTVAWIGTLLSINRFARIFTNAIVARACGIYGFRLVTVVAVLLAIFSTAGYAFASGMGAWVLCRICWGLSYSVLRLSAIAYSLDHERQGFSLGLSKSIQEAGPMITLIAAPFLFQMDVNIVFFTLAVASIPALYFASMLPPKFSVTTPFSLKRFLKFPSAFNLLTFFSAILIEGILVVTIGVLLLSYSDNISILEASILAAFYLGYRRVCLIIFSPFGGWIADRYGLERVFVVSFALFLSGLFLLTSGWIEAGAIIIFAFYSVLSALTPGAVSSTRELPVEAVSENATWRDVGAALGTLAGGLLLASQHVLISILSCTILLSILFLYYTATLDRPFKYWMTWR